MKQILDNVESKMKKAADNLEANLRTIRTGRANANMLERVSVEYYGSPTPINQISSIQVVEGSFDPQGRGSCDLRCQPRSGPAE